MEKLFTDIRSLAAGEIGSKIKMRLREFQKIQSKGNDVWYEELCFCILAANAKSRTSWAIQKELGAKGFLTFSQQDIAKCILRNKHRFHNTKAKYLVKAREFRNIRDIVQKILREQGASAARKWLAENIIGFGYKEASHFLRNVGFLDFAILDRHVMNVMREYGIIKQPKNLSPKRYLLYEKKFQALAQELSMKPGELDVYVWYMKAGDVLK